ncbi:hypothetical protein DE4576_05455 [Mycobacterium marinum]|nr:hypothetical protein DE4576_05455 [Mycobacterium marinum]
MQRLRQDAMAHGLNHFDQSGSPSSGLSVADIGFHRSQPQGMLGIAVGAVGGNQRAGLDRITQSGAGAVGFDHIDLIQGNSRVGGRLSDNTLLSGPVGGAQSV